LRQDAKVMALVGLAHGASHFGHMLLPPMFAVFMAEFALSFSQVGLLMTVFFVVSGVGQALMGFVVDKVGARPLLLAAMAMFAAACAVASLAQGYAWLLAAAALAGLANSPMHPADFTILNQRVSPARLGYSFSVHGLAGSLGWALAPLFFVGMLRVTDWHRAYAVAALLYVAVLVLLLVYRDQLLTVVAQRAAANSSAGNTSAVNSGAGTAEYSMAFMRLPVVWWCFGFFVLSTITLAVVQSYSVPLMQVLNGASFEAATATLTAYLVCGALGTLLGGWVAARQGQHSDRVVAWCMASGALAMVLCATGWLGPTGSMLVLALAGFAIGIGGPSRDMLIKRAAPKGATGRVYGMVYSGLDVGFAVSPLLFGALMDRQWYSATLLGAAAALLLSVGAALMVGRRTAVAA
jgi:MFS transporter, FSR family, fosmidomycin resistance protein